jgi:TatD DNase family protein
MRMLVDGGADEVGGVFHCFAEDGPFAAKLEGINFYVSFPGIVTFKKATNVHEAVAAIPLERMLIETDGPFLAPEPHRGKRCESAFVPLTAQRIAEIKGVTIDEVARITTANCGTLFGI